MHFLRNPEIKKLIFSVFALSSFLIFLAFLFDFFVGCFAIFFCVAWFMLFYFFTKQRYAQIAKLSTCMDQVLHGEDSFFIETLQEGELAILRDELYKMTVRLREQAEHLKEDKLFLRDSLANISHQIKTPLTSLNLIASMLRNQDLSIEKRISFSREMSVLLERLDWLVDMMLKISKLDADTVFFSKETILLKDLIKEAVNPFLIPLELRNQQLQIDLKEETIQGDFGWTIEAIGNILKNSMEHNGEGCSIFISGSENPLYTELCITDQGEGVHEEELPLLFERFYQGKQNKGGGYGIGLALAKMIITKQNGTILAQLAEERGMQFVIRFYKGTI